MRAKARARYLAPFAPLLVRSAAHGLLHPKRRPIEASNDQLPPVQLNETLRAVSEGRGGAERLRVHWPEATFGAPAGRAEFERWHRGVIVAHELGRVTIERDAS